MDNPETSATLGKQEWTTQRHQQHWANKNGQPRDISNIGQTRMENLETSETLGKQEWTTERHQQHWANKNGQPRDISNIGQTRHRIKTNNKKNHNTTKKLTKN
jgi:hypothetical protein